MHPTCDEVPFQEVSVRFMWLFLVAVKFPIWEAAAEKVNQCSASVEFPCGRPKAEVKFYPFAV